MSKNFFGIYGYGVSGQAVSKVLEYEGEDYVIFDSNIQLSGIDKIISEKNDFINLLHKFDTLIVSPGIPDNDEIIKTARRLHVNIISEIEFAYARCKGKIIAITGTNGKSSATTFIYKMLKKSGFKVYKLGNIGVPFSSKILEITHDSYVVLEVSHAQLANIKKFRADISILLNIKPEHRNWGIDFNKYKEYKMNVFKNLKKTDLLIANDLDCIVKGLRYNNEFRLQYFSNFIMNIDTEFKNGNIFLRETYLSSFAVKQELGISDEIFQATINDFKGLEGAMELVECSLPIKVFCDSKATNQWSTIFCLKRLETKVLLVCGGANDKLANYTPLARTIMEKGIKTFLIGETGQILKEIFQENNYHQYEYFGKKFLDAFEKCLNFSVQEGYNVVFSPGANSRDLFLNHFDRRKVFIEYVEEYSNRNK
jgi:UDP-N-acetylmuramoyl-L-alanine--D-glutamate ligase